MEREGGRERARMRGSRMKMKAGPDPSLSSSLSPGGNQGVGAGGRGKGGQEALGSDQGPGRTGKLQRAGGSLALMFRLDRWPTSGLGPQFPQLRKRG